MRGLEGRIGLALLAAALLAAACSSSKPPSPSPQPGSIDSILAGTTPASLLSSQTPMKPGPNYYGYDLVTAQGAVISGGAPQAWIATDRTSPALGPYAATWFAFAPASDFNDPSILRSALPGTYAMQVEPPKAGGYYVAVVVESQGKKLTWLGDPTTKPPGGLFVTDGSIVAQVGTKAISVKTPVATTAAGLKKIDTRRPPDDMHYISLDKALTNGKPTVVVFSTPYFCESRLCGPVTDETLLAFQKIGPRQANFIHVEEWPPYLNPPPGNPQTNPAPAFVAWHFPSEPWVIVIDKQGIIRDRFEGPVTATQIEAALQPLL